MQKLTWLQQREIAEIIEKGTMRADIVSNLVELMEEILNEQK